MESFLGILVGLIVIYLLIRGFAATIKDILNIYDKNKQNYKWLLEQLNLWREKNVVTDEQSEAILQFYNLKRAKPKKKIDAVKIILIIGAIFLGVGVIFLVASNWRKIPAHIRTINLILTTIITLYLGYYFSYKKEGFPLLGKSLLFLSSIFWGSSIILICQIYNIPSSDNWLIVLLWALPILPIAYFFDNKYVFTLASILLIVWNVLYSHSNNVANYYYPMLVFGLMLPIAFNFRIGNSINIIGLLIASFYCCFFEYNWQYMWLSIFISTGLLINYLIKKKEEYICAASLSFTAWQIIYFNLPEKKANFYFIIPLIVLFFITYRDKLKASLCINIISFILWFHFTLYPYSKVFNDKYNIITTFIIQSSIGILLYLIGLIHSKKENYFADLYKVFGYATVFGCTYFLSFKKVLITNTIFEHKLFFVVCLILMSIALVMLIVMLSKRFFGTKLLKLELVGLFAVSVGNLFILFYPASVLTNTIIMNAIIVLFAVINIFYGMETQRPAIFNSGIGIFVLFIITRYIDIFWELKEKSWFFIIGGLFMIFGGIYLEKQRRKVIEKWEVK